MMNDFKNLSLIRKLIILISPILIISCIFAGAILKRNIAEKQNINFIVASFEALKPMKGIVHETQRERGMTAGFIGSGGKNFSKKLIVQRKKADANIQKFITFFDNLDPEIFGEHHYNMLKDIRLSLNGYGDIREKASKLSIGVPVAFKFYTGVVESILSFARQLETKMSNVEISYLIKQLNVVMQLKEYSGRQRAAGSVGLSKETFNLKAYRNFAQLDGIISKNFNMAVGFLEGEHKEALTAVQSSDTFKTFIDAREKILKASPNTIVNFMTGPDWFKLSSSFINSLAALEDSLLANIEHVSNIQNAQTAQYILFYQLLAILGLIFVVLCIQINRKGVVKPFVEFVGLMEQFSRGKSDIHIDYQNQQDEVGQMARALSIVRDSGVSLVQIRTALDNMPTAIWIADMDGGISYANSKAQNDLSQDSVLSNAFGGTEYKNINMKTFLSQFEGFQNFENEANRESVIDIKDQKYGFKVKSIINEFGEKIGYSLEISNNTEEFNTEVEIANIVKAASQGDLDLRLQLDGKTGFIATISENVNGLMEEMSTVIQSVNESMTKIAAGNLNAKIQLSCHGAFETLKDNINQTIDMLGKTLTGIQKTSSSISKNLKVVQSSTEDLSRRSEIQASNLEETAASMEEMGSTVSHNSQHSTEASNLSIKARSAIEEGTVIVSEAVEAMGKLDGSSAKIESMVSIIDEIAFQTNLLALNASVEAARAGDAGRGFAVVAEEVRSLAQRSASAAKDIRTIVSGNAADIQSSVKRVEGTGQAFERIKEFSNEISSAMAEIASSSQEQSTGILEINSSVADLDNTTQQNARMVDELYSIVGQLGEDVKHLNTLSEVFQKS